MKYNVNFDLELRKHSYPGIFIVFEGVDASGKTTHSKELVEKFEKEERSVIYTKEPTDGEIGKLIRRVLAEEQKVPPVALQYLFCADRAIHQEEIINHLEKGDIVVSDRYFWSAAAYGIADLGGTVDFYSTVYSILSFYNQFISPDYTFFLDVEVDEAVSRIEKSHKHHEIYDKKEKIEKIRDAYMKLIDKFPTEFTLIDANKPIEEVSKQLFEEVNKVLK